jgi:hypothetical protein
MTSLKMAYMGRNTYEEQRILINIYGCMCSQFDSILCNKSTAQNMDNFKNAWGSFQRTQNRTHQETRRGHSVNQTLLVSTVDSLTHSLTHSLIQKRGLQNFTASEQSFNSFYSVVRNRHFRLSVRMEYSLTSGNQPLNLLKVKSHGLGPIISIIIIT